MVALSSVRAHNTTLKSLPPNLVAVFVGGTSGIGLSTAREFVRNTTSPHVYLVGRNQTEASNIITELQSINATSKVEFIKSDVSLLKSVDQVCEQIKEKEKKVNLLFMTAGYFTFKGREETSEGLDRKFSLHYYARMRFIDRLSPLLTAAASESNQSYNLSRVVSVLDPNLGRKSSPNYADLSLKHSFSLKNCAVHASAMNNLAAEHFAKQLPGTSFIHAYPSGVATGVGRDLGMLGTVATFVLKPFSVALTESGERHLFAATAPRYAAKAKAKDVEDVAKGSDDVKGSGAYFLNWNGDTLDGTKNLVTMREDGAEKKIWDHTKDVFEAICNGLGKY